MNTKVVAIIGCGRIAKHAHMPALTKLENVRIKYVCDILIQYCYFFKKDGKIRKRSSFLHTSSFYVRIRYPFPLTVLIL